MRKLIFLSAVLLCFASCTNVTFVNPQPEFLESLTEIPEKYQGRFASDDTNEDVNIVTDTTINGMSIASDSLVVKTRGNYFYVNFLNLFLIFQ